MDPDVIRWSDDEVLGDREVIEVCLADDKEELTPLEMKCHHLDSPKR
jgi:hypothetical protein